MIQPSAFRQSPADLPGSCRRTRCPTASYTTPGDTIAARAESRSSGATVRSVMAACRCGKIWVSPSFDPPRRNPEQPRRRHGVDRPPPPPGDFVSEAVVVPVVGSAQGDREFVADLAPQRAGLGEPQMMGISRASAADQTGLRGHEFEVGLVAMAARFADGELAFLDFGGTGFGLERCLS